ncbi:ATP-dependent DNA helicase RecG [Sinanaerobacter chloroacetimidivorans]|uniref:ATP-dependent DNA helicase RecG n=1 Tax=Sinanaerobacter chloroacetimidivorans TaxID=2818044 RepID=A0A8J8B1R8_9FIRM|nr:ATP-dependent DNA helicase RecG [Sinanaerobacter chloroacetimidivorans]MBR0596530.1 ATP-dependent DNA helicase RecG [Sinanaerobacter chloroacetimidivorans]
MNLHDKTSAIKGIGAKKASALKKLNIENIEDFFSFYPRDYEDRRERKEIRSLTDGETALIKGKVILLVKGKSRFQRKQTLKLLVQDDTGSIEIIFFHSGYLDKVLIKDEEYDFYGKVSVSLGKVQMLHPDFTKYEPENEQTILPVYPLTSGISQGEMRKWQKETAVFLPEVSEYLPADMIDRNRLCGIQYALEHIHFPKDKQKLKEAKYRLIFEELLLLQTGLLAMKNRVTANQQGIQFSNAVRMEEYASGLPYKLTGAQRRVISEINDDMESMKVMNRLVQGDVGSGKTAVAACAIFKAVKSGYQAVLMAPTELLARQHYDGLQKEFLKYGIKTGFLSGSIQAKEKKILLEELLSGEIDVVIGTHAVIQPGVKFFNLGLVITDEQHRFGVNQRAILSQKGENPDILVMTATPIPRTLAVILYGDLDISIIDEMPPGRQPIITRIVNSETREASYEFVKREVRKGRQAYVVAPLIAESDTMDIKSALGLYDELKEKFKSFIIAFLHGGMKQQDKDRIMKEFSEGFIDILISTVVIEVGINVPNATIMLIENAERFGLAQLHQLRGRVGRGEEQSYCVLITSGKSKIAQERAEIMKSTTDGFIIAEKDLQLRGPGEFFGMRQHGVPDLKLADLVKHIKILNTVRDEAALILTDDAFLAKQSNQDFRKKIDKLFQQTVHFSI